MQQEIETLYTRPGQLIINSDSGRDLVGFNEVRDARVCLKQGPHVLTLTVTYDNKSATVYPGNCFSFETSKPHGNG